MLEIKGLVHGNNISTLTWSQIIGDETILLVIYLLTKNCMKSVRGIALRK